MGKVEPKSARPELMGARMAERQNKMVAMKQKRMETCYSEKEILLKKDPKQMTSSELHDLEMIKKNLREKRVEEHQPLRYQDFERDYKNKVKIHKLEEEEKFKFGKSQEYVAQIRKDKADQGHQT